MRDCVSGMIAGAEAAEDQVEIYNLGSLDWMNVRDIADIVVDEMHLPDVKYQWTGGVQGGRGWVGDSEEDVTVCRQARFHWMGADHDIGPGYQTSGTRYIIG